MLFAGIKKTSLIDWPPNTVTTLFTRGCNLRCPWCQNPDLVLTENAPEDIPVEEIYSFLDKNRKWIDGICITGGEPLVQPGLEGFLKEMKNRGVPVKLDSNGYMPLKLKSAIEKGLVSYIAMDIKAPLTAEEYSIASGTSIDIEKIIHSIHILREEKVPYEFRTTLVPGITEKEEVEKIAGFLKGAARYVLQNFRGGETLDSSFNGIRPYEKETLLKAGDIARSYVNQVEVIQR